MPHATPTRANPNDPTNTVSPTSSTQCYFLEPIKREVSQPFSTGMPKAKVCERLKKKSAEICTIKYRAWPFYILHIELID